MSLDIKLYYDVVGRPGLEHYVFEANVTHNLIKMADAAGIYSPLWRPEEQGITHARQLAPLLAAAISTMAGSPDRFRQYDASNGWGTYDDFLPWLRRLRDACEENPDAKIWIWR